MTVNSALNVEEAGLFPGWNDRKFVVTSLEKIMVDVYNRSDRIVFIVPTNPIKWRSIETNYCRLRNEWPTHMVRETRRRGYTSNCI